MIPPQASEVFTTLCLGLTENAWAEALLVIWVLLSAAHQQQRDLGPVSQAPL